MRSHEVSIVIPVYNGARFIRQAVISGINQQTQGVKHEVVVVNDGSTDGTARVLHEIQNELPQGILRVVEQDNMGQPAALNRGVTSAKADNILLQDADDMLHQLAVLMFKDALDSSGLVVGEKTGFTSGSRGLVFKYQTDRTKYQTNSGDIQKHKLLHANWASHPLGFRKSAFETVGGFDEQVGYATDYDFVLKYMYPGGFRPIGHIPYSLYWYREHDGSMSKANRYRTIADATKAVNRALKRLGESKVAYHDGGRDEDGRLYYAHRSMANSQGNM